MYRRCDSAKKTVYVDFGQVEVGSTAVKSVKIFNESCKDQIYEARRDPTTNPMDYVFNLCDYTWILCPEETCNCEIVYRPLVPSAENVDYFTITDSMGICIEVIARGSSIGPDVYASTDRVVMVCSEKRRQVKKHIKLINKSKTNAMFMFDICNTTAPFFLDVTHGTLGHNSEKHITIIFAPDEEGMYTYYLHCLIHHQSPIMIELYGACNALGPSKNSSLGKFIYSATLKSGFEGYMDDSDNMLQQDIPLISLSKSYFSFSPAYTGTENIIRGTPQVVCLTNHSETNVLIKWSKDANEDFNITPPATRVQPKQCVMFEVFFSPSKANNLFAKEIIGLVFYEDQTEPPLKEATMFPSFISIRVTGHSFPMNSDGWIPQYDIPQTIIMPACIPSVPTYATFLIKAHGHLPLMFRFVPPSTSLFVVKPMLGVIYQDYQVIVVRMLPEIDDVQAYMERWGIQFNGNSKNECCIDFRGYAEYANIRFSNNNSIIFAPTLVGCQQTERLSMRNVTRHVIKYQFTDIPPTLHVQRLSGEITSNAIVSHKWTISSTEVGYYDFEINCVLTVLQSGYPVGTEVLAPLRIAGRIETGCLVAIPSELNFGVQRYDETVEQSIHVFNFSAVNIHYKLTCVHQGWPLGCIDSDVKLRPICATVCPGRKEKISVSITPHTPGYYQLTIRYLVREHSQTDSLVSEQCPVQICRVNCMCVLPTFEVRDIHCYGSSKIASKAFLWNTLKINKINTVLKRLLPGEEKSFFTHNYSMALTEQPVYIKLLLMNPTPVAGDWYFKRVQLCSCKAVSKPHGISFRRYEYDCEHRKVCLIYPKSGNLKPREDVMITIELRFILPGETEVQWEFNIGNDRRIFISIILDALSGTERKLNLLYGSYLKFEQFYVGDKEPSYEICWVHNYMEYSVPYSVDCTEIYKINEIYCNELFTCVTPHGIVEANTSQPIIFKFEPRQFGQFEVTIPLVLGDSRRDLLIEGNAHIVFGGRRIKEPLPAQSIHKRKEIPVYFSADTIDLIPTSMHNHIVNILLIHNHSMQDIITYEWKSYEVPGILDVKFYPNKSIIQPNSTQSVRVVIDSKGYSCRININIPCEFFNATKRREYHKNIFKYNSLCKELEGQFVIKENSTTIPEPWLKILEKPTPFIKVLCVRCLIYDPDNDELHTPVMAKLKNAPKIELDITKTSNELRAMQQINIPVFILQGMLWNVLNSNVFQYTMRKIVQTPSNLYYSQFKMDILERKQLETRVRLAPPRKLIEEIFGRMLFIIVHEEFSLETIHFIKQTDVRNINFLKLASKPTEASEQNERTAGSTTAIHSKNVRTDSVFNVSFFEQDDIQ